MSDRRFVFCSSARHCEWPLYGDGDDWGKSTTYQLYGLQVANKTQSFLSPIIAGYMAADGNWRLCYWVTAAVDGVLLAYFCFFFEESKYIPHLEARPLSTTSAIPIPATKKDTISTVETGEPSTCITPQASNTQTHQINPDIPLHTWRQRLRLVTKTDQNLFRVVWTSVVILFRFPAVMYTALTYAFCLCWISAQASIISMVFTQPPYNFGTVGVGNMSLGVFIGCILGSVYGALSDKGILWFTRRNYGYYEPEMRLQLNHFPALCMGGGFIMFGVTTAKVFRVQSFFNAQYLQL